MKNIFYAFSVLLAVFFFNKNTVAQTVTGKGKVVTESVSLDKFSHVGLGISANVYITSGNSQSVKIKGQKNIIDLIKKEVKGDSWNINFEKGTKVKNYEKLEVHITMSDLKGLAIGGSGSIIGQNKFNTDDLDLAIGGSGDIELEIDGDKVSCSIGGSGNIDLRGSADGMEASIGGSGNVNAMDLDVDDCVVSTGGSGDVEISVSDNLLVSIAGSGNVKYSGNPTVKKNIVGSGSVKKK